jgi:GNAT superfamily N-acetyltransferase
VLAASFGAGAVVSASPSVLAGVSEALANATRDDLFDATHLVAVIRVLEPWAMQMAGPFPKLLCGGDILRDRACPDGFRITVDREPAQAVLDEMDHTQWPNTWGGRPDPNRPVMLLARAWRDDELIGTTTAGADSPLLWQIGIDVAAAFQGRGIGAALTSRLARETLEAGCVPFYSVAAGTIVSFRTALAAGFRFAWIEAYSVARP